MIAEGEHLFDLMSSYSIFLSNATTKHSLSNDIQQNETMCILHILLYKHGVFRHNAPVS
jgi:hypothetical protein